MYWNYFKYIVEHKYNVFIEAIKLGLFWHAITHDLSKFLPSEFFPYAKYFYGENLAPAEKKEAKDAFLKAWKKHYNRNKHHWNHWLFEGVAGHPIPMPKKYVKQMIADWRGMSRKSGDTAQEYYLKNRDKMSLHGRTEMLINDLLFK